MTDVTNLGVCPDCLTSFDGEFQHEPRKCIQRLRSQVKRLDADAACEKAEKESLRLEVERLTRERNVSQIDADREKRIADYLSFKAPEQIGAALAERWAEHLQAALASERMPVRASSEGVSSLDQTMASTALGSQREPSPVAADSSKSPQSPIARIVVANGKVADAQLYAPGLPDGVHDLYCEPEAVAPMMGAERRGACPLCGADVYLDHPHICSGAKEEKRREIEDLMPTTTSGELPNCAIF